MADFDWNEGPERDGLVAIETHSLYLSVSGPPRPQHAPAVIIITGITSSIREWPAAIRMLNQTVRVFAYERSGYGMSEESPNAPSATTVALELRSLLRHAKICPPYLFVAHSWGGILVRELAELIPAGDVAGVVFVDANTEETPSTFPNPYVRAVQGGMDTLQVCYHDRHKLEATEWEQLLAEEAGVKHQRTADREVEKYHESGTILAAKRQLERPDPLLGDAPVVVLSAHYALDLQRIFDEGIRLGNGTAEQCEGMRRFISTCDALEERMQRQTLKLSHRSNFRRIPNSGHNIHMAAPEEILSAVQWILETNAHQAPEQ